MSRKASPEQTPTSPLPTSEPKIDARDELQSGPETSKEEEREMSFATAIRRVVEDRFTYEDVQTKLEGLEDNEKVEEFLEDSKKQITELLLETTEHSVEDFLTGFDERLAESDLRLSPTLTKRSDADDRIR
jgi:hypothetical protein